MEKRLMTFIACLFLSLGMALAQTQVSGKVTSAEDGEPVIGASIKVAGTNTGTVTDVDGNFSLNVPAGAKLEVTYLGMLPQTVKAGQKMKIVLEADNKTLDEVVVTAMGISRDKKALGYASQKLGSEDLNIAGTSSLASAMQGKLTGVDIRQSSGAPGASSQIVIRGARSFSGDNTPLYVVDGMPIASSADYDTGASVTGADKANRSIDINPDDIESIDVLKAHAAITRQSSTEGMVLLKNDAALPIQGLKTVALFGVNSYDFMSGGLGSGAVNVGYSVDMVTGLKNIGVATTPQLTEIYQNYVKYAKAKLKADKNPMMWFLDQGQPKLDEIEITERCVAGEEPKADAAIITIGRQAGEGMDRQKICKAREFFTLHSSLFTSQRLRRHLR